MSGALDAGPGRSRGGGSTVPATTLVWIDTRTALVAREVAGRPVIERVLSGIPHHHRGRPHLRRDPLVRHGGGGDAAEEARHEEYLARFLEAVAARIEPAEDVVVIGPGEMREHLAARLRESDGHHGRRRGVASSPSDRVTEHQLVTQLRTLNGDQPPRRTHPPRGRSSPRAGGRSTERRATRWTRPRQGQRPVPAADADDQTD